jgi:hypothetical protein
MLFSALASVSVKIAGIAIAVSRRNQNPLVAKFATVGFSLMLIAQVGRLLVTMTFSQFVSTSEFAQYIGAISFLETCVNVVGWVFLFIALFGSHMNRQHGNRSDREFGESSASSDDHSASETGNPYQAPV